MSVLKAILIEDQSKDKIMTCFPDKQLTYWDVLIREKSGVYWYWQMHFTSIADLIYRAGINGHTVKLRYEGEPKDVKLQQ